MRCIPVSVSGQTACGCLLCSLCTSCLSHPGWKALACSVASQWLQSDARALFLVTHGWNFTSPTCPLESCWEQDTIYRFIWLSESFPSASLYPLERGQTTPGDFHLFLQLFSPGLTILILILLPHLSASLNAWNSSPGQANHSFANGDGTSTYPHLCLCW